MSSSSGAPASGTNRLADEVSAYLRQHMHNPVDWHPWGPTALEQAARDDKPLLVSIGYSACHWCHVMAHESFEDPETAALMNDLFVNVKVDREERPDVDQIYMDTVVRLTGHGGWPLTLFCLPDGRPYYGGTYYPKTEGSRGPSFRRMLVAAERAYREQREDVEETAGRILKALDLQPEGHAAGRPGLAQLRAGIAAVMEVADPDVGGMRGAPKFPTPTNLELLLCSLDFLPTDEARDVFHHLARTAHAMARRGLYDHLGGGFHRYCVDSHWTIPHFEKMLYDQGLLLRFYAEMWRRAGAPDDLLWPMRETAAYLAREMTTDAGGFRASQDADSEGSEGRFYVWKPAEIAAELGDDAPGFCKAYGVSEAGNFEGGTTHLVDQAGEDRGVWAEHRERLHAVRERRVPPDTDPKCVAAWNGYAISGLARMGSLLPDPAVLAQAARAADFVLAHMIGPGDRLHRVHAGAAARGPAFLDDHAALLDAYLDLVRAGAGERYLVAAFHMANQIAERFFDADQDDLFLTPSDGERLPHRPRSDHDGATPQASGLAVLGLLRLSGLSGRSDLEDVANRVIDRHAPLLERAPHAYPTLLRAVALRARGLSVAIVVGDPDRGSTQALALRARRVLLPDDAVVVVGSGDEPPLGVDPHWLAGREPRDGRPTAYVCRGGECSLPVTDPDDLVPLEGTRTG